MLNSIILATGAVVMGFGYGYFLVALVWLIAGWWWKSLNIWRAAFVLFTLYILGVALILVLGFSTDLFLDRSARIQIAAIIWCLAAGYAAFALLNKNRFSPSSPRRRGSSETGT